jgi:hypothetical protein
MARRLDDLPESVRKELLSRQEKEEDSAWYNFETKTKKAILERQMREYLYEDHERAKEFDTETLKTFVESKNIELKFGLIAEIVQDLARIGSIIIERINQIPDCTHNGIRPYLIDASLVFEDYGLLIRTGDSGQSYPDEPKILIYDDVKNKKNQLHMSLNTNSKAMIFKWVVYHFKQF